MRHCVLWRLTPPFVFLLFGTSCPRQRSVGLEEAGAPVGVEPVCAENAVTSSLLTNALSASGLVTAVDSTMLVSSSNPALAPYPLAVVPSHGWPSCSRAESHGRTKFLLCPRSVLTAEIWSSSAVVHDRWLTAYRRGRGDSKQWCWGFVVYRHHRWRHRRTPDLGPWWGLGPWRVYGPPVSAHTYRSNL